MGYIDRQYLTDIHFNRVLQKDPALIDSIEALVDIELKKIVRFVGLTPDQIPVDTITGYTTSEALIVYGVYLFYIKLFESIQGGVDKDDVYKDKIIKYSNDAEKAKKDITLQSIIGNEENKASNMIRSKPMW